MNTTTHPSKYLVRAFLEQRAHDSRPPPSPQEIRRQLGWDMLPRALQAGPARADLS